MKFEKIILAVGIIFIVAQTYYAFFKPSTIPNKVVAMPTITEESLDTTPFNLKAVLDKVKLEEITIGKLSLPTGKIVAYDPFMGSLGRGEPFRGSVPPGKYPVKLLLCNIGEDVYRIAFAKIEFSDRQATSWSLAVTEDYTDEEIKNLKKGNFFGYGVDTGLGCFMDAETHKIFRDAMDEFQKENPKNDYLDLLEQEFEEASRHCHLSNVNGNWANHFPNGDLEHNVIMFSTGWGDGSYPTYWGKDANGDIVEIVTEFFVVDKN